MVPFNRFLYLFLLPLVLLMFYFSPHLSAAKSSSSSSSSSSLPSFASTFSHYSINATLDDSSHTLYCTQNITISNTFSTPNSRFYFRLANQRSSPNHFVSSLANDVGYINGYQPDPILITSIISDDGTPLSHTFLDQTSYLKTQKFSTNHLYFFVDSPNPILPGKSFTFTLSYSVSIPNVYNNLVAGDEKWAYNHSYFLRLGWYPTEIPRKNNAWQLDQLRFAYHYVDSLTLHLPLSYTALIPGNSLKKQTSPSSQLISNSRSYPVISSPIAFSPDFNISKAFTPSGKTISVYYLNHTDPSHAQQLALWSAEIFHHYEQRYGPKPFKHLAIVNTPFSGWWGMAGDEVIFLGDNAFGTAPLGGAHYKDRLIYYLLAHEIAHLWSGIGTIVNFDNENVFSEGLTEFLSSSLFEEKFGNLGNLYSPESEGMNAWVNILFSETASLPPSFTLNDYSQFHYLKLLQSGFDQPAILPQKDRYLQSRSSIDYLKGNLLFKTLHHFVGPDAFSQTLSLYFSQPRPISSNVLEFKRLLQASTPIPLDDFFDHWFFSASSIDYSIDKLFTQQNGNQFDSRLLLHKKGAAPSHLDVKAFFKNGSSQTKTIQHAQDMDVVSFTSSSPLDYMQLDPNNIIPEKSKLNNASKPLFDFYLFGFTNPLIYKQPLTHYFLSIYPQLSPYQSHLSSDLGLGLNLIGKNHFNHIWRLGGGIILDEDTSSRRAYQANIAYSLQGNHNESYHLNATYDTRKRHDLSLFTSIPFFTEVDSGFYGHLLYPERIFTFGISHSNFGLTSHTFSTFFSLSYIRIVDYFQASINFRYAPPISNSQSSFSVLSTSLLAPTKLFSLPLVIGATSGYAHNAPLLYLFSSSQLRGNTSEVLHSKFLKFSLDFPFSIINGMRHNLFNNFLFRGISGSFYSETGTAWSTRLSDWTSKRLLTIGAECSLLISGINDISIPLTLGYGATLLNPENTSSDSELDSEFYFSFSTPLTLFNAVFGY